MRQLMSGGVVLLALAGGVRADLVTNGGFETGDLTGWSQFGDNGFSGVGTNAGSNSSPVPHSGTYGYFFGNITDGGIRQTLTASAGATIQVDFWLANVMAYGAPPGSTPNSFSATLGGIDIIPTIVDSPFFGYRHYTGTVTIGAANPVLEFDCFNVPHDWFLDDVSASTVVPLPMASVMGMGGLASVGVVGVIRRRRRR